MVPFVSYFMFFITGVCHGHSMSAVTVSSRSLAIESDSRIWHDKRLRPVMAFYWLRFTGRNSSVRVSRTGLMKQNILQLHFLLSTNRWLRHSFLKNAI